MRIVRTLGALRFVLGIDTQHDPGNFFPVSPFLRGVEQSQIHDGLCAVIVHDVIVVRRNVRDR